MRIPSVQEQKQTRPNECETIFFIAMCIRIWVENQSAFACVWKYRWATLTLCVGSTNKTRAAIAHRTRRFFNLNTYSIGWLLAFFSQAFFLFDCSHKFMYTLCENDFKRERYKQYCYKKYMYTFYRNGSHTLEHWK